MSVKPINWQELLKRYQHAPPHIRSDIANIVAYAKEMHAQNLQMREELHGAMQTMLALCRAAGGSIEIPVALVDSLDARDSLHVVDIDRPLWGRAKQFSYVPYQPTKNVH